MKIIFSKRILRLKNFKISNAFKVIEGQRGKMQNRFCKFWQTGSIRDMAGDG